MSGQDQYLYKLCPTRAAMLVDGPTEAEGSALAQHFAYLEELVARGAVLLAGRTQNNDESAFGIVVFRADSDQSARSIMDNDPAVKHQVMHAELFPYRVALLGEGWAKTE